jgi:transposase
MDQLHKRFTDDQICLLFQRYCEGMMSRTEIEEIVGISKTRFFALLKAYRQNPEEFSIAYIRTGSPKLTEQVETEIEQELRREKALIQDPQLPIGEYNYSALRDRLRKKGIQVSVPTIIERAKRLDCHKPRRKAKVHDREVVTTAVGALVQHDASLHLWSPYAQEKWTLITSIDDYSRKLLFAEFFPQETSWSHIQAAQRLMQHYGIPLRYYVDNLRVFRFVQNRDSFWRNHVLQTDEVDPQWRQVMRLMGVEVSYALSPQAKGKVERPYRWLQDRIVRTCALEKLASLDEVRSVLQDEVDRYNNHQVHSTTGEIPAIRFAKAKQAGNSLFRPFTLPKPYTSLKDVFCLRDTRIINGYRRISVFNKCIEVPKVPLREDVELHLVPDLIKQTIECRIWWQKKMVHSVVYPLQGLRVHF